MSSKLPIDRNVLVAFCRKHRIRRLSLFGSTLKGTNRPDSDVDLLVEFEAEATPNLLTMAEIELELSALAGRRKIDLRTAGDLSRYFRDEVVRTAEPQYDAIEHSILWRTATEAAPKLPEQIRAILDTD